MLGKENNESLPGFRTEQLGKSCCHLLKGGMLDDTGWEVGSSRGKSSI